MPILKQLVATSAQTKRRSRMDLTREMISAPLGDFRHTMHVGRSGDAFGDTSFLSSHSGEPTPETKSFPRSPRPGLLLRTFRSSKRSQSVNRVDEQGENNRTVSGVSPIFVKNAMSLPFLNDESTGSSMVSKSLSPSPFKQQGELDDDGAAAATNFLELQERGFGDLTELPESVVHNGGGMKHAESVMSFHVDLGPSMLGDILNVMEKEDDDLGFEEGKNSEGRASPALSHHGEEEDGTKSEEVEEEEDDGRGQVEENGEAAESIQQACMHQDSSVDLRAEDGGPYTPEYTPEIRPKHMLHLDSCSMSSSGSAALDEKPNYQNYTGDTDSATFSAPPEEESNFSSFLDEEDDEIHV